MKTIEKKLLTRYFSGVKSGRKTFEIRTDEDDAQVGDMLILREWDGEQYTGNFVETTITYILRDAEEYGLEKGYCIYGIRLIDTNDQVEEVLYTIEKLRKELKDMRRRASAFLNSDYSIGYLLAISNIEGIIAEEMRWKYDE